jgi:type I restriction enzyme S subunit
VRRRAAEFPRKKLSEVCSRISSGGTPSRKRPEYFNGVVAHPWVKSQELLDSSIRATSESITDLGLANSAAKYFPIDTILLAMYGANVGQLGYLRIPATVNQAICGLCANPDRVNARYLFYALMNERPELITQAAGAAQQNLNQDLIRNYEVPTPDLNSQVKIASILSAYDDLIENNYRRIKLLEEMAQRIYREWFVDFRYPGHQDAGYVDSELGRFPGGWVWHPLLEVAEATFGFPFDSARFNLEDGKPVIRIRDIPIGQSATRTTQTPDTKYGVLNGDILIGMDGDFHMGRWSAGDAWLNQRVVRFRVKPDFLDRYSLFLALEQPIADWNQAIVGTTVAHLGKRHLELIRILVPPSPLLKRMAELLDPIFDAEIELRQTTRLLCVTRDLLLPRLISGEIDVADLDIEIPGAVA